MKYSYIIIDDNPESTLKTLSVAARFQNLQFIASAHSYNEGLDLILEHRPTFVFLEVDPDNKVSNLSLLLINELHRFLKILPRIIITSNNTALALEAIKYGAFDYLSKPTDANDLRRTILKFERNHDSGNSFINTIKALPHIGNEQIIHHHQDAHKTPIIEITPDVEAAEEDQLDPEIDSQPESSIDDFSEENFEDPKTTLPENGKEEKPLIICVKSYGDYRFIEAKDICYLQADNNSTDIHLINGEMITAFKTLKHFENVLSSPFVRIHNSYIVNIDYVSRIHTGNSVCYIKNTTTKLPFSKSYKENVDAIINSITNGNYLEI